MDRSCWRVSSQIRSEYKDEIFLSSSARSFSDSSSLVLDGARGELVEAPVKSPGTKLAVPERSLEALKSHSEAEKRRRARINGHFDTLRGLVPGAKKLNSQMDKASLLGEVINRLKTLKRKAAEASEDCVIPKDTDEVKVEQEDYKSLEEMPNYSIIRVSLSCDYRPGLLSDLQRALEALHLTTTSVEIATLGKRMKNVLVMTVRREDALHARSISQAIRSVIGDTSTSGELLMSALPTRGFYLER